MTDLHTHILPGMDDGAKDAAMSLEMLRMEWAHGIDTVALTSHFYRDREKPETFLSRRQAACERLLEALGQLPEEEQRYMPRLILGAEVAWVPNLQEIGQLPEMCIGGSQYMLLEMPFSPWNGQMFQQLHSMMDRTGIVPVIAHLERYLKGQKPEHIRQLLALGLPVQVSAKPLLHWTERGKILKMLKDRQAQVVASDCHNTTTRPPDIGPATAVLRQKLGDQGLASIQRWTRTLTEGAATLWEGPAE